MHMQMDAPALLAEVEEAAEGTELPERRLERLLIKKKQRVR
jgi:hypothetical protein